VIENLGLEGGEVPTLGILGSKISIISRRQEMRNL
jgi:hypothetical protein